MGYSMTPMQRMYPARAGSAALAAKPYAPKRPEPPITDPLPDEDGRIALEDGARRRSEERHG